MLDPFLTERKEDVQRIKSIQKDIHESFKTLVRERRGKALQEDDCKELFSGTVWSGKEALEIGLIDEIGDLRSVMKREFGSNVKLKKVSTNKGMLSRLLGGGNKTSHSPEDWIDAAMERFESRALWARFGI